jgi:hypothetical protein
LPTAGLAVWIVCLAVNYIVPSLPSQSFRIIAMSMSLIFSISLFIKNKSWHKVEYFILIILNAALIFVNATGLNTITTNFDQKTTESQSNSHKQIQSTIFDFSKQKNWWPDVQLMAQNDSLVKLNYEIDRSNQALFNQFAFLKDWVKGSISDKSSRDTMNKILQYFGSYENDTSDLAFIKLERDQKISALNKQIDYLNQELSIRRANDYYYTVDGKNYTPEQYVKKLGEELSKIRYEKELLRVHLKLEDSELDSLLVNLKNKYGNR